jgi:outer membrane immunogenic protein
MKRVFFAVAAIASTIATGAMAAPPQAAPIYNWTGFYVGGNIGYSWGRSLGTEAFSDATSGLILSASANRFDMNGVIGGAQAGYNWQRDRWVYGLEADIQGSGQKGETPFSCTGGTVGATVLAGLSGPLRPRPCGCHRSLQRRGVSGPRQSRAEARVVRYFRGRIGVTATPTFLVYARAVWLTANCESASTIISAGQWSRSTSGAGCCLNWEAFSGLKKPISLSGEVATRAALT